MLKQKFVMGAAMIAGALAFGVTAAEAGGNATNGATVFQRCAICHNAAKGAGNKIGPDLFGVVGRKAGTEPGYSYSGAMKSAGFAWTNEKLDAYVKSPALVVPGNKMAFAGLPNDGQRADLIAYLDTLK
jgi:cytochrome c